MYVKWFGRCLPLACACAVMLFSSGCRKRVVTGPEKQLSKRYHSEIGVADVQKKNKTEEHKDATKDNTIHNVVENIKTPKKENKKHNSDSTDKSAQNESLDGNHEYYSKKENAKNINKKKDKKSSKKNNKQDNDKSGKNTSEKPVTEDNESQDIKNTAKPENTSDVDNKDVEEKKDFGIMIDEYKHSFFSHMSIYPCQYLSVFFETSETGVTVNSGSEIHKILSDASAENVAADLGNDSLEVSAEWVKKKNPDFILKCVKSDILGKSVKNTEKASDIKTQLKKREDWEDISAIKNDRILLLSEELLENSEGQLMLKYYIAQSLHPELFEDIDVDEVKSKLLGSDGIFAY